ncbi:MAG: DUF3267 domain-containing protein, partial [Candidatus Izemoplasmataceae bacterium]
RRIPPTSETIRDTLMGEGWKRIREPSNLFWAFLFSIPFALISPLVSFMVIALVEAEMASALSEMFIEAAWSFTVRFDFIIFTYLLIVFHEVVHLVLIPDFVRSMNTFVGIKPWGGFVFTSDKLSKGRFLMISFGPFLALSVIFPIVLALFGVLGGFLVFLAMLNAAASSVDALNALLIFVQVPRHAVIINNGFETYYKVE